MTRIADNRRDTTTACAFALAIAACVFGLVLCFTKSPQLKSVEYVAIAQATLTTDTDLSVNAAWKAARLDPSSVPAWHMLAVALQLKGEQKAASDARMIAARVVDPGTDHTPVYAMPAEFRLSFLADAAEGL